MRWPLLVVCVLTCGAAGISLAQQGSKEKPKETAAAAADEKSPSEDPVRKGPAKPSAEAMAAARKLYGYDCAMCHGANGDGKGDLAEQMKLDLHDWRDASSIANKTDGELFTVIAKGKGKMPGSEGNRISDAQRWNLVSVVRGFGGKSVAEKASAAAKP